MRTSCDKRRSYAKTREATAPVSARRGGRYRCCTPAPVLKPDGSDGVSTDTPVLVLRDDPSPNSVAGDSAMNDSGSPSDIVHDRRCVSSEPLASLEDEPHLSWLSNVDGEAVPRDVSDRARCTTSILPSIPSINSELAVFIDDFVDNAYPEPVFRGFILDAPPPLMGRFESSVACRLGGALSCIAPSRGAGFGSRKSASPPTLAFRCDAS